VSPVRARDCGHDRQYLALTRKWVARTLARAERGIYPLGDHCEKGCSVVARGKPEIGVGADAAGGCPVAGHAANPGDSLYYWDYLRLDGLLDAQAPKSIEAGSPAHD
jgi:hypothetical protein